MNKKDQLRGLGNKSNQELDSLYDGGAELSNFIEDMQRAQQPTKTETVEVPAPVVQRNGYTIIGNFAIHTTGLEIADNAQQNEWLAFLQWINAADTAIQWIIGDWLAFGDGKKWLNEETNATEVLTYEQIAEMMGGRYTAGSLRQFAHTARNVSALTRVNTLSFGHHRLVADLREEKQKEVLQFAVDHNLSVKRFRRWLNGESINDPIPASDKQWTIANKSWETIRNVWAKIEVGNLPTPKERKAAQAKIEDLRTQLTVIEAQLNELES